MFRMTLVWLVISFPFSLPLGVFYGSNGLIIGILIGFVILMMVGWFAEWVVVRVHHGSRKTPIGLRKTMHRVLESYRMEHGNVVKPHLLIYPDPSPNAVCCRGIGTNGTVLVSQGMTALLNEVELRYVLRECLFRCESSRTVVSTICGVLASLALGSAPRQWVNTALLGGVLAGLTQPTNHKKTPTPGGMTPVAAMRFLLFYPFVKFLLRLGRQKHHLEVTPENDLARVNATHKLKGVWDYIAKPEYLHLYLLHNSR